MYIEGELLTKVTIPGDITKINSSAFFNCSSIQEVIIPKNIICVGKSAFVYCTSLTSVEFEDPTGWYYKTSDNVKKHMDESVLSDKKSAANWLKSISYEMLK